jgi:L-ornithine N5-oxygenase
VSRVDSFTATDDGVRATVEHLPTGTRTLLVADALVYATGYKPVDPAAVLGDMDGLLARDAAGRLRVDRDYRITTTLDVVGGIYLHGGIEHTHGISSTLLSNSAIRSGEIVRSLVARRLQPLPSARRARAGRPAHMTGARVP